MLFSTLNIKKLNQKGNNNDKERKMKSNASWTEGLLFMSFFFLPYLKVCFFLFKDFLKNFNSFRGTG